MAESLVLRVKRLVSGSVNGLVDAMENSNPELVMREAIREIERAADDVRDELAGVVSSRHQTWRLIEKSREKHAELEERAQFAVEQGRDDLAEAALSRQLDMDKQIPALEKKHVELASKQSELEGYLASLAERRKEMEADIASYVEAREAAASVAASDTGATVGVRAERRAENAQGAFDRAMNGRAGASPLVRADRETQVKLNELERFGRKSELDSRLAALKAKTKTA